MRADLINSDSADAGEPVDIPGKLFFRIGEVSSLVGVEPFVLRYWESEFPGIAPKRSGSKQRLYRRKDVELLLKIKHLLYERRFTIEGARQVLKTRPNKTDSKPAQQALFSHHLLPDIRRELCEILKILQ